MNSTRSRPAGRSANKVRGWWLAAAMAAAAGFAFAVVAPRLTSPEPVSAAGTAETTSRGPLPTVERAAGPVLEPGRPIEDLEPGTAKVGKDGRTYGLLPVTDIPAGTDPARIAPDFIAITTRDGTTIAGYVKRDELYPPDGRAGITEKSPSVPVYAADGTTVVGAMYLNKGFIDLDEDPDTVAGYPSLEQLKSAQTDARDGN